MKTTMIVLTVLTGLMLFSTMVCGFWMASQDQVDPSSVQFHMVIAIATALLTVATAGYGLLNMLRLA
jgi:hypothetical protein